MKIPKDVEAALLATGRPWSIKLGKRHLKLMMDERLVGILPRGHSDRAVGVRSELNVISQIRRAAKTVSAPQT